MCGKYPENLILLLVKRTVIPSVNFSPSGSIEISEQVVYSWLIGMSNYISLRSCKSSLFSSFTNSLFAEKIRRAASVFFSDPKWYKC